MPEADALLQGLLEAQNADGGWSYTNGSSWTEPTAFALLALGSYLTGAPYGGRAPDARTPRVETAMCMNAQARACDWLRRQQRADGGWPPHPSVAVSTWVTSLAHLALPDVALTRDRHRAAVEWIVGQIKSEPGPTSRFVLDVARLVQQQPAGGSPWFPGTAAWVAPTALSAISLSAAARRTQDSTLLEYVEKGKQYLLATRCYDHGWNHGGSKFRSQNAESYPEITGLALLALKDVPAAELKRSLDRAEAFLAAPGSSEALSWLELGLWRHGRVVPTTPTSFPIRAIRAKSLRLLALARWTP
jgi:hypothetical protein